MNSRKKILLFLGILWCLWIITYFGVHIQINGNRYVKLKLGEKYHEDGASASFLGHDIIIRVQNNIQQDRVGKYQVTYKARNFLGIARSKKRIVEIYDATKPTITLKGNILEVVSLNSVYQEPGYIAEDDVDGDLTNHVVVESNVNTKKEGIYEIVYRVMDSSHNSSVVKRVVRVQAKVLKYDKEYDKIDNTKNGWWTDNKFDKKRPNGGANLDQLKQYGTYFLGNDDKIIYLTFDEGSNDTYLDKIADVLTENNVYATFFLCGHFMESHQEEVKKWVSNGHSIGNHTFHHRDTVSYANRSGFMEFQKEITDMEELYQKITGKAMEKLYRPPRGEWSYRELKMVQDMGYRSYLWSADYLDFDKTYTKEYALEQMMKRYHNGAIYMLHPKQKGTYEALEDFIKQMKSLGYKFGLVKDISY